MTNEEWIEMRDECVSRMGDALSQLEDCEDQDEADSFLDEIEGGLLDLRHMGEV